MNNEKQCFNCKEIKLETEFPIHHYNKNKIPVYRNQCKVCRMKVTQGAFMSRRRNNSPKKDGSLTKDSDNKRKRVSRQNPEKRPRFLLEDSRKEDKKKSRDNDLTLEFVTNSISNGCCYCGEKQIKICLDRIDNSKGHTQNNVVPACIRCNSIRGSMPYEAWLYIAPSVREAREKGLFDCWNNGFYYIGKDIL